MPYPGFALTLLQAPPRSPLWHRLKSERRIIEEKGRESNVEFLLTYEHILALRRDCIQQAFEPRALFSRFEHQTQMTYPNRIKRDSVQLASWKNISRALQILGPVIWRSGTDRHYRNDFCRFVWPQVFRGNIEAVATVAMKANHMIRYARGFALSEQGVSSGPYTARPN